MTFYFSDAAGKKMANEFWGRSTRKIAEAFAKQAKAFDYGSEDGANVERLLALPFIQEGFLFHGAVTLTAHRVKSGWHSDESILVQAVSRSDKYPLRIFCGKAGDTVRGQVTNVLEEIARSGTSLRPQTYLIADSTGVPIETPAVLRPLQLYSITGGKLAQLLS